MPAPRELDADEKRVWNETMQAFQAGWFTLEDEHLLRAYCRACANHAVLSREARGAAPMLPGKGFVPIANPIFAMLRAEAAIISTLARNLRISKVARTAPSAAKGRPVGLPPGAGEQGTAPSTPWAKTA